MGTTLAPLFGGYLILGRSTSGTARAGALLTPAAALAEALVYLREGDEGQNDSVAAVEF